VFFGERSPGRNRELREQTNVRSPAVMAEAWAIANSARAELQAENDAVALEQFGRAYELSRDPALLLQVARLEQRAGHLARASNAFETFLEHADESAAEQRDYAARQLRMLRGRVARLQVQTNVQGAELELEPTRGVAERSGYILTLLLDAGERKLSLSKPGYETQSISIALQPGEVRTVRVDLDKARGGRSVVREAQSTKPRLAERDPSERRRRFVEDERAAL